MLILAAVVADRIRIWIPTAALSISMVPFATVSLVVGTTSWILPRKLTTYIDNLLYTAYMRTTLFVFENVSAVKINLYGDVHVLKNPKTETALIISNHQSDADWAAVNIFASRQTPNGAECALRFIVKDVIHFVPLFGWYIYQRGYVYVKRFGNFVPEPMIRQLKRLCLLEEPFWLHLFPEGTRYNIKKTKPIEASRKYCEKNNLKLLKHLLTPRAKAFQLSVEHLRESLDCIYDLTFAYSNGNKENSVLRGNAPNMLEFCGSSTPYHLHIHLRRIPIAEVPTDAEIKKKWLFDQFQLKDKLLDEFYTTNAFPDLVEQNASKFPLQRNFIPFLSFTSAAIVLPVFFPKVRLAYLITVAMSPLLILWLHLRQCV